MDKIVGIGEYAISNNKNDILKTFALSSCIAVTAYSPSKNAAGMVHIVLPSSSISVKKGDAHPCYYADTGIPFLIDSMCSNLGCSKDELQIKIFGGAASIRKNDMFHIGRKNIETVKAALDRLKVKYNLAQVGGMHSRTIFMEVATGDIKLMAQPLII